MRVRFSYISRLIEEFGLDRVREPHVKHVQGLLWEMRMKGKDGISRAIYVRNGNWAARGCGARLRQKDPEDPKT